MQFTKFMDAIITNLSDSASALLQMLQRLELQLRHTLVLHPTPLHWPEADGAASWIRDM
jgi:hypothetical protein